MIACPAKVTYDTFAHGACDTRCRARTNSGGSAPPSTADLAARVEHREFVLDAVRGRIVGLRSRTASPGLCGPSTSDDEDEPVVGGTS